MFNGFIYKYEHLIDVKKNVSDLRKKKQLLVYLAIIVETIYLYPTPTVSAFRGEMTANIHKNWSVKKSVNPFGCEVYRRPFTEE